MYVSVRSHVLVFNRAVITYFHCVIGNCSCIVYFRFSVAEGRCYEKTELPGLRRIQSPRCENQPQRSAPGKRGRKLVSRGRTTFPPPSDAGSHLQHCATVRMPSPRRRSPVMTSSSARSGAYSTNSHQKNSRS